MKTCITCGESKRASGFYASASARDGLQSECKECSKARAREWNRNHPERVRASVRRYRERNPGYDIPQSRAYVAAMAELRERHRDEFERIYRKHRRKVAS